MKTAEARVRIRIRNILFATDFSPASVAAARHAAEIARYYGAKLFALHVRSPVSPIAQPITWKVTDEAARIEAEYQKRELLQMFSGLQPEILIEEGNLWSSLEVEIAKNRIDLLVIGTRGRSGIAKLLLGSSAEEIFREAPCPVLTVGPRSPIAPVRNGEATRILFASDFSPESMAAAPYAISLAQEYQAYLTLLHVIEEPKACELVQPSDLVKSSEQLLRDLVPEEAKSWCVPEYIVEEGAPAEKILEVATRRRAELIVLGIRRPSGVPGAATHLSITTAHKVVCHATCPVLTVRG